MVVFLVLIPLLGIGYRAWTGRTVFGSDGVVVRNVFKTHALGWGEIEKFFDSKVNNGEAGPTWALGIQSISGTKVTCFATSHARRKHVPNIVAAIERVAVAHAVPVEHTVQPRHPSRAPRREVDDAGSSAVSDAVPVRPRILWRAVACGAVLIVGGERPPSSSASTTG
jgi:hypothetical protein